MICKCRYKGKENCKKYSFILTMWYVNFAHYRIHQYSNNSFILTMWYVNIEISKDQLKKIYSFILTMWYVNRFADLFILVGRGSGFILTMWYVNNLIWLKW